MKKSTLGLIGLLALMSAAADAATITITRNPAPLGLGGSYSYDFPDGPKSAGPLFSDIINFSLSVAGDVKNFITDTDDIASGLKVSLFDVTKNASVLDCNGGCGLTQDFGNLFKGDAYKLTFSGTITGDPSSYGDLEGHLNVYAPVPEASTLAMMFAGFGMLVVYSLRRRSL